MTTTTPAPQPQPPPAPGAWQRLWPAVAIILAAGAAYWNSLSGPFVFDDLPAIVQNGSIRHLTPFRTVLIPPGDGSSVTGRPLINLSFALNHAWGGTEPRGYHVTNLVIHALAGLALLGLVRRTLRRPALPGRFADLADLLAGATALLWVVHPLQTESVTFVVQRTESLMGLFYLVTMYCFARAADAARPKLWLGLTCLSCAAGMGCKEVMVTAPIMVWLYDRTFVAGGFLEALRRRRVFYLALAATWLPLLWLIAGAGGTRGSGAGLGLGITWWSYALKQCEAIVLYLKLSFWPHPLSLDYGAEVVTNLRLVAPQALALLLLVAGTLLALWRRPVLGFLGAWFFVILAPSSSIVPLIGQTMAEHRMYLPLAAVIAGVVAGLFRLLGGRAVWPLAVIAVALGGLTAQRNHDYRDAVALWTDTVAKQPANYRAHCNLGVELTRIPARRAEAIAQFEEALRLEPRYAEAHNNLAIELMLTPGRESEAVAHYETALRLRPDFADAQYNLAVALGPMPGRAAAAIRHYEAALRLQPNLPEAHNNLAVELAKIPGRLAEAAAHYEAALRLQPDYPEALYGLANALALTPERRAEAIPRYEAALRLRPDYPEAHYALAVMLAQIPGRAPEAIGHYEEALRLNPSLTDAHYNLAAELAKIPSRLPEAIAHYEAAVRLKPDFLEARNNLAGAYYRSGRLNDAINQLTIVLRLNPQAPNARRNLEMLKSLRRP